MRRRYIAALAVFVPVVIVGVLQYFYPLTWKSLSGYMVLVALAFKGALLSFWSVSKLKILAFFKGLTLIQGAYLLLKRWFLDNVFARWLKRNVTDHLMHAFREMGAFYASLNLRKKIRNVLLPLIFGGATIVLLYWGGLLDKILLFTELKVIVISLSKTLLLILSKLIGFVFNSWVTPILEVFALSYIFTWLEEKLGKNNPLIRLLDGIGRMINHGLFFLTHINRRYLDPILNDHISRSSQRAGHALVRYIDTKKIDYEYEQFERFERTILDGHIDAYHRFKGMESITDKRTLYTLINRHTDDNLEIVGFLSRNAKGDLLPESVEDSFYHDVFFLEGFASSHRHGVRHEETDHPDHTDFWVLNTSKYPFTLHSHSGHVPATGIPPHSVQLIKTAHPQDYSDGDIYGEFRGRTETLVPIEPRR